MAPTGSGNLVPDHSLMSHAPLHSAIQPVPLAYGSRLPHRPKSKLSRSFSSDESALNKQILATHSVDMEDLNVTPILVIVEEIMRLARPQAVNNTTGALVKAHSGTLDQKHVQVDKALQGSQQDEKIFHNTPHRDEMFSRYGYDGDDIVKNLAFIINKISCEIICKCSAGAEAHSATMDLLNSLSNYSWDAKVVIALAAFSIKYGDFWLVEQLHTKNPLARNMAILKDLTDIMIHSLEQKFTSVVELLNTVLKVTHLIIAFKELPRKYISHDAPELAAATDYIPTAVYWIIKSLLACASILLNLIGRGHEYLTSAAESWEILSLAHKLSVIMEYLQKNLTECRRVIETNKELEDYAAFCRLMEQSHIDNMKVLRAMIRSSVDHQKPLYDGTKRTNESVEMLRQKYVLLLITDLEIPHEELNVLHLIYNQQSMRHEYEILWLPIVRPTTLSTSQDTVFYDLRNNMMPWYSVDHPSLIEPVANRYIREVWNFEHMPMVVVLDPQGRASNIDALPMMWIWGSNAFPFTKVRERALWADVNWTIELLADAIDPRIPDWITDNKVICLYGGEDIEWIRKFTLSARAMATALHIPLEMLYVGKRNPRGKVQQCHEIIDREKLSHIFSLTDYYDYIWYFWVRIWSMWNSKRQLNKTVENDAIMQQIMDVLTYDSSNQGWAIFSRGNYETTKGMGDVVVSVLDNYKRWGQRVDGIEKFVPVLDEALRGTHPEHHCNRLILPSYTGYVPERVACSECGKIMDKFVMYSCCND